MPKRASRLTKAAKRSTAFADFVADMSQFDDTVPPDVRNWRLLPRFLLSSLMKRNTEVDTAVTAEKKARG